MAVSGGPDSMALMVLARAAGLEGRAVHVDHGLRCGSDAEAGLVEAAAVALGFGFESRRVEVGAGPDLEARARRARYAVLPEGVLTGHTMDDQAETVLLNIVRGAALDGLRGMSGTEVSGPPVRRPLLGLRRRETAEVCRAAGIEPFDDPSNRDPRFRRNRIRSEVLPLLDDVAGRDVAPLIARLAVLAGEDLEVLEGMASQVDPTSTESLRAVSTPLARRAVRGWLRWDPAAFDAEAHPPSLAEVERVLAVARGRYQACEVSGGRRVARTAGRLRIVAPAPAPPAVEAPSASEEAE